MTVAKSDFTEKYLSRLSIVINNLILTFFCFARKPKQEDQREAIAIREEIFNMLWPMKPIALKILLTCNINTCVLGLTGNLV